MEKLGVFYVQRIPCTQIFTLDPTAPRGGGERKRGKKREEKNPKERREKRKGEERKKLFN